MTCILTALILAVVILAAPLATEAQPAGRVYRIGWINTAPPGWQDDAFRERLHELGYVEGRNIRTEWRWVEGRFDQPGSAWRFSRRPCRGSPASRFSGTMRQIHSWLPC